MSAALLQALIAAGFRPADAGRVTLAVEGMVGKGPATTAAINSQFSRPPGVGYQPVSGKKDTFALYASAPQTNLRDAASGTTFGPGGGALGVNGVSVFDGDIYCSSTAAVENLIVRGDADVADGLEARNMVASRTLAVGTAMGVSQEAVTVTVPLVAASTLSVAGSSTLNVQTTLTGRIDIQGQVFWQGAQNPAVVNLLTAAVPNNDNTVTLFPNAVTVLSNHGQGAPTKLKYEFLPTTKSITYVTKVVFDHETCSITTTTETIDVVTAVKVDDVWKAGDVKVSFTDP
jgi:hypothetical protein